MINFASSNITTDSFIWLMCFKSKPIHVLVFINQFRYDLWRMRKYKLQFCKYECIVQLQLFTVICSTRNVSFSLHNLPIIDINKYLFENEVKLSFLYKKQKIYEAP